MQAEMVHAHMILLCRMVLYHYITLIPKLVFNPAHFFPCRATGSMFIDRRDCNANMLPAFAIRYLATDFVIVDPVMRDQKETIVPV